MPLLYLCISGAIFLLGLYGLGDLLFSLWSRMLLLLYGVLDADRSIKYALGLLFYFSTIFTLSLFLDGKCLRYCGETSNFWGVKHGEICLFPRLSVAEIDRVL